jgi:hypothetical protein
MLFLREIGFVLLKCPFGGRASWIEHYLRNPHHSLEIECTESAITPQWRRCTGISFPIKSVRQPSATNNQAGRLALIGRASLTVLSKNSRPTKQNEINKLLTFALGIYLRIDYIEGYIEAA